MNTKEFIKNYCKPTIRKANSKSLDEIMNHIVDYETIREYLLAISYKDYLQTFYWKSISAYVRSKFTSCKCGSVDKLHVHHNTYKYIGIEHLHVNCLDVLCENCHSLIHSCEGAPKSKDRGVGYSESNDDVLKKYNTLKANKKKQKATGKTQAKIYIELLVKNRLYAELARFKKQKQLPISDRMTKQQMYMRVKDLIQQLTQQGR